MAIEFMPGALAVQVDDDGAGSDLDEAARARGRARRRAHGRAGAGRLPGAGVAADRRPAAVSRSAARSALSAGRRALPRRIAPNTVRRSGASATSRTTTRRLAVGAHEVGQQRHGLTVGDQREQHQQVVGAVAHVGLEPAERAAGADRQLGVVAVGLADRPRRRRAARRAAPGRRRPPADGRPAASGGTAPRSAARGRAAGPARAGRKGYSSPSTRSRLPSASAGIDVSGSASVTSTRSAGCSADSRRSAGASRYSPADWIAATRSVPVICSAVACEVGLGLLDAREQRVGVRDERLRRRGQPHVAPDALEQRDARLALEQRELLGDRGRAVGQRFGDRADRPAGGQLAQQAEALEVEHREEELHDNRQNFQWTRTISAGLLPAMNSAPEPSSSSPRRSRSASCRCSASSPSRPASASPRSCSCASRSPRRSCGPRRPRGALPRAGRAGGGARAGARRGRLRDAVRPVLPGPGPHGRVGAVADPLQLPRTGDGGGDPPQA